MIIFLEEVIINWIPYTMVVVSDIGIIILLKKKDALKPIGFLLATIAGSFIVALGLAMFLPALGLLRGFLVKN